MKAARSFKEVLDKRGRIVLFTATATIGLRLEQEAERNHAQVVSTRGWADKWGPMGQWGRIHRCREFGLLSCNQATYTGAKLIFGTDFVWVGETGDPMRAPFTWGCFSQCMSKGDPENPPRLWLLHEDAV